MFETPQGDVLVEHQVHHVDDEEAQRDGTNCPVATVVSMREDPRQRGPGQADGVLVVEAKPHQSV